MQEYSVYVTCAHFNLQSQRAARTSSYTSRPATIVSSLCRRYAIKRKFCSLAILFKPFSQVSFTLGCFPSYLDFHSDPMQSSNLLAINKNDSKHLDIIPHKHTSIHNAEILAEKCLLQCRFGISQVQFDDQTNCNEINISSAT